MTDNVAFAATATTTYMVTGTDGNGCVNTASTTVTVNTLPAVTATASSNTVCAGDMVTLMGGGASSYTWDNGVTDNVAFAATATTTYMVTGTDGNGCMNTASTTVTVNTLPAVTATASSNNVCTGDMVTLMGGGATSYTWDNGVTDNVAFSASSTTTYNVTGTDGNGCMNTASTTVTVNALPVVTLTAFATDTVCSDSPAFALTGESPAGGIYSGTGVASGMFDPAVAGPGVFPITYTVTDANSCSNSASQNITVEICTGVEESISSAEINVYPNPTSGSFSISFSNVTISEVMISIVDIQGKEVFNSMENNVSGSFTKQINLENIAKGMYYIKLSTGSDITIRKLMVH
ncbi:MAG: T9SS type A sorting domain-containing protein [Bacteroidota bacterium]|nr:T9SS type A sorting domain-containing protein [Bacteroidota bacterium]